MSVVLVIEDDPAILRGIADNLVFEKYDVLTASDGETGYRVARERRPDAVILDLMLPRMSGYEVCRKLRDEGATMPIIILTARGDEADRVLGLDIGADDYVTKPFGVRELLARLRAVLRRGPSAAREERLLRFDDVEVDFRSHELRRDGRPIEATRKEIGLLRFLSSRPGEVVRRDALLEAVWGYTAETTTRTVDNHVALLRAKIEVDPKSPRHLVTVHGVGYKWVP
jgi:DNA-binding response OmpR family regulator